MPVSVQLLTQFPLLQPLSREELDKLSHHMHLCSFPRRAMVLSKDAPAYDLGFLVDGRLQGLDFTVDGRSVGLYFVDPGDYFGELPIVDGRPPSEFIVAAAKSTVAFLDGETARKVIHEHQELSKTVMNKLAWRIRDVMTQRTLLSLPNPFQRLCALLIQLPSQNQDGFAVVEHIPTHQELAIMINASRETVTRAFQLLFTKNILSRDGNSLKIVQPNIIKDVAEGRMPPPKA